MEARVLYPPSQKLDMLGENGQENLPPNHAKGAKHAKYDTSNVIYPNLIVGSVSQQAVTAMAITKFNRDQASRLVSLQILTMRKELA